MSVVAGSLGDILAKALRALQEERREHQRAIEDLDQRQILVRRALEGAKMDEIVGPRPLSIKPERLTRVRNYMQKVGQARQVDISKELGENSGTISVALRVLEGQGEVQKKEVDRRSYVWYTTNQDGNQNGHKGKRETKVRPGEGVSEGRIAA